MEELFSRAEHVEQVDSGGGALGHGVEANL